MDIFNAKTDDDWLGKKQACKSSKRNRTLLKIVNNRWIAKFLVYLDTFGGDDYNLYVMFFSTL
jgi:hypothetical protein